MLEVARHFQNAISFDFLFMGIVDAAQPRISGFFRIGFDEYQTLGMAELLKMTGYSPEKFNAMVAETATLEPGVFNDEEFRVRCRKNAFTSSMNKTFNVVSGLFQTVPTTRSGTFVIAFFSRESCPYVLPHAGILQRLTNPYSPINVT